MRGASAMCMRPRTANVVNHTNMMGPKTFPTAPVPRFCTRNKHRRMAMAMGMTQSANPFETSSKPSTADRTEIAGVMTPSPYRSAVPNTPSVTRMAPLRTVSPRRGKTIAVRARMPPSPLLSARITNMRYLMEMMMMSDQNAREQIPNTLIWSTVITCDFSVNASLNEYSGLVPMSP